MRSDNLAPLLTPPAQPGLGFRQGLVVAFNANTGANTIEVGGATLSDVPMLNSGEAVALKAGHIVGLLTWQSSWWILGRITLPNSDQFASASVAFASGSGSGSNFALSITRQPKASGTLSVPPWVDEALVLVIASARAVNTSANNDVLYSKCQIDGEDGSEMLDVAIPAPSPHALASVTSQHRRVITNPGSTIAFSCLLGTNNGLWPADATNQCTIDAIAIYRSTS